jgi:excisionase family DNA binding protein
MLSLQQAAEYLGVDERSVRRYISTGAIRARRLPNGRLIRIALADLDAALKPIPVGGDQDDD